MNSSLEYLPWRVAATAGLIVAVACAAAGIDVWVALQRVGIAFVLFGLVGFALRAALRLGQNKPTGTHIDQKTPPLSVEDISHPASKSGRRGDEGEK